MQYLKETSLISNHNSPDPAFSQQHKVGSGRQAAKVDEGCFARSLVGSRKAALHVVELNLVALLQVAGGNRQQAAGYGVWVGHELR